MQLSVRHPASYRPRGRCARSAIVVFLACAFSACAPRSTGERPAPEAAPAPSVPATSSGFGLEDALPVCPTQLLRNLAYVVCMRAEGQIAAWTAYRIVPRLALGAIERTDDFREDRRVSEANRAELDDYRGSGFDRGHLAPANIFKGDAVAMSESFFLTNMIPQASRLNRGPWRTLEAELRDLALRGLDVWVVTGASGERARIGDGVVVPEWVWKAVVVRNEEAWFGFAALAANDDDAVIEELTVDALESTTGYDFFAGLDDAIEDKLEATLLEVNPSELAPATQDEVNSSTNQKRGGEGARENGCCRHCSAKSKPCGDSCISKSYTCRKPPGCACR